MPTADRAAPRRKSGTKIPDQWLRQILSLLYQRRNLSRFEIIDTTGLNAASVSRALRYLLGSGVLHKAGDCDVGTGRRRGVFTLNAEAGYFVALDLEGDRLRFGLTNFLGDVRCRWEECLEFRQPLLPEKVVEGIAKVTRDLDEFQLGRVLAVGVSYPGLLDAEGRLSAVNLGWTKVPLLAVLKEAFPWPVFMERDKETCIHAESWLGAAHNSSNGTPNVPARNRTSFVLSMSSKEPGGGIPPRCPSSSELGGPSAPHFRRRSACWTRSS